MNKYLILALGILALSSCKKETAIKEKNQNTQTEVCTQSDADKLIEEKILAFKDGRLNANAKGQMDTEETIWLVEAALNYTYGNNNPSYLGRKRDSIAIAANTIDLSDATALYQALLNKLSQSFYADYFEGKTLTYVDVEYTPTKSSDDVVVYYESADPKITSDTAVFDETDYWEYGFGLGKCGGFIDTTFVLDAAKMLQNKLQSKIQADLPTYTPCPNARIYWTNQTSENLYASEFPNFNDPNPNDNYYDYLFYYSTEQLPNDHTCISPDEMNWYYYSMYYFIKQRVDNDLRNIMSFNITGYQAKSLFTQHKLFLNWGEFHFSCDDTYPIELPQN